MGPYLLLYAALIGFFAFSAIYHAVLWSVERRRTLLAVFSVDCVIRAALSYTLLTLLTAESTEQAYAAVAARIALVFLMMIATTWSVRLLSGVRADGLVWFLTIAFSLLFVIQVVSPLNPPVTGLQESTLPWGETVTTPLVAPPGWWIGPMLALAYIVQLFSLYCGVTLRRRDRASGTLVIGAACATLLILSLEALRAFQIYVAPLLGAFPNVLWVCVIALLIARHHRQTQNQLVAGEQRFRGIFEQTFQFIGLLRTDGILIEANRTALEFAGVGGEDVINRPFWEGPWWSHSPTLQAQVREAIRAAADGAIVRFEATHPRRDGTLAWVDFSLKPIRDDQGRVTLLIPEGRDITSRKQAEESLQSSESRTRAILQAIPDLMFRTDSDGCILDFFTSRPEELYRAPEMFLGKRMQDVLPPDTGELLQACIRTTSQTRQAQAVEYRLELPQLGAAHFEARMVPCDSAEIVMIVRNITERKQAEEKRAKLEARLTQAQKMEAVGRLAGGIAHDFNNLLTVINGNSELVLKSIPPGDRRREILTDVSEAGARAAALTRQLLTFGRRQISELRVVDLNDVVTDAGRMLRRLLGDHVRLSVLLHEGPARVKADPGQLDQVIMNLAVNARDAMPGGGGLTIQTEIVELDDNDAGGHAGAKSGRYVVLAMSDTGCGMSPDVQARIFEPFFTTKAVGRGTGLGLATVHNIAVECGGFLTVASEPGRGSRFQFFLPAIDEPAAAGPADNQIVPSGGAETILLVEDDDAVRLLALRMLQQFGYLVLEASGGPRAIRCAETHPGRIDLLVTDFVMPEMSGRELTERLQAIRPDLRTLYISGYTDDAVVRHGVTQAETAFLQKPFTLEGLAGKVRQLLDAPGRKAG